MKFSSVTDRLAGENSNAWDVHYEAVARAQAGEDIIVLSVGQESDQRTPDHIVASAIDSLRRGRHHYTPVDGSPELREAIVRRHGELTGQLVTPSNCTVFAGAQNALFAVAQCVLDHGDEVILTEPYYTTYPAAFSASGADIVSVPVKHENGFQIEPRDIIDKITDRTQAIVLNSPNNPLGAVYTKQQYQALVDVCVERDIWLISDEVYLELLPEADRVSPCGLAGGSKVCVTVSSLSKSHRMTGWRLGWAVGPESLIANLKNLSMCMSYGLSPFIMDAAVEAINSRNDVADDVRRTLDSRRDILTTAMSDIAGMKVYSTGGGMFVVLDIRSLGLTGPEFALSLLNEQRVSVLPCDGFGRSGAGLLRISLCASDEQMAIACQRIARFVESLDTRIR